MAGKIQNMFGASRFVLPEQREAYLLMQEEHNLTPKPQLEEDELNEIHYRIQDSRQYDYELAVRWWLPTKGHLGVTREMRGRVQRIDDTAMRLQMVNEEKSLWISMDSIVGVRA